MRWVSSSSTWGCMYVCMYANGSHRKYPKRKRSDLYRITLCAVAVCIYSYLHSLNGGKLLAL